MKTKKTNTNKSSKPAPKSTWSNFMKTGRKAAPGSREEEEEQDSRRSK